MISVPPRQIRFRAKREQLKRFSGLLPSSQGQSLALTVLYVALTFLHVACGIDCLICGIDCLICAMLARPKSSLYQQFFDCFCVDMMRFTWTAITSKITQVTLAPTAPKSDIFRPVPHSYERLFGPILTNFP